MKTDVAKRMEFISELFLNAQNKALEITDFEALIAELDQTENEFRSVAYESAAMTIASREFEKNFTIDNWLLFLNKAGAEHNSHIHVGLGWALAQKNCYDQSIFDKIEPIMQFRVLDGFGFYDSILRKRKTIDQKIIPSQITDEMLVGYDQGIGRRMYYFTKGTIADIEQQILSFPRLRQKNLWRGAGLACSFVGGCQEEVLKEIFSIGNKKQLMLGAAIVADARNQSNAITNDLILVCQEWCKKSITEMLQIINVAKSKSNQTKQNPYIAWLETLLGELSNQREETLLLNSGD